MAKSFVVLEVAIEVPGISTPEEAAARARSAVYSWLFFPRAGGPFILEAGAVKEIYLVDDSTEWESVDLREDGLTHTDIPVYHKLSSRCMPTRPGIGDLLVETAEEVGA